MPINAAIPLSYEAPKVPDMVQSMGTMMNLKNAMLNQQSRQLDIDHQKRVNDQMDRAIRDEETYRNLIKQNTKLKEDGTVELDMNGFRQGAMSAGLHKQLAETEKYQADTRKAALEAIDKELEVGAKRKVALGNAAAGLKQYYIPDDMPDGAEKDAKKAAFVAATAATVMDQAKAGNIPQPVAAQMIQSLQQKGWSKEIQQTLDSFGYEAMGAAKAEESFRQQLAANREAMLFEPRLTEQQQKAIQTQRVSAAQEVKSITNQTQWDALLKRYPELVKQGDLPQMYSPEAVKRVEERSLTYKESRDLAEKERDRRYFVDDSGNISRVETVDGKDVVTPIKGAKGKSKSEPEDTPGQLRRFANEQAAQKYFQQSAGDVKKAIDVAKKDGQLGAVEILTGLQGQENRANKKSTAEMVKDVVAAFDDKPKPSAKTPAPAPPTPQPNPAQAPKPAPAAGGGAGGKKPEPSKTFKYTEAQVRQKAADAGANAEQVAAAVAAARAKGLIQ